jgi:hypothetical protein
MTEQSELNSGVNDFDSPRSPSNFDPDNFRRTICEIIQSEARKVFRENFNETLSNVEEDSEDELQVGNDLHLSGMDRIPDVVKGLREFSGNIGEYGSWRKAAERVIKAYAHLKGTPKYYGIISTIRNKIVGNADTALESYNIPLNWNKIIKCLNLHYADKRDIGTLENQMFAMYQKGNSVEDFYKEVYNHLSLILEKLSCMNYSQDSLITMTQTYRDKALDTFVRGLKGDLPRLLAMREPQDLPQALHLCLKLDNMNLRTGQSQSGRNTNNFRMNHNNQRNNSHSSTWRNNKFRNQFQQNSFNFQRRPVNFHSSNHQNPFKPQYQGNQYQVRKIEPANSSDNTRQARSINYSNTFQTNRNGFKRPSSPQHFQQHSKLQRINHIQNTNNAHHKVQEPEVNSPSTSSANNNDNFLD